MALSGLTRGRWLVLTGLCLGVLGLRQSPVVSAPATPPLLDNASCENCHQATWKEWKASRHAVAGDNAPFNFEYEGHPGNWCLGCHSPRMTMASAQLAKADARKQGVDCLGCHLRDGMLYSASKSKDSPHATVADTTFGNTDMCAGCHQFNFPELDSKGSLIRYTQQTMQDTANEFLRSSVGKAGGTCTDCHMPRGSHQFPGAYSATQVQKALGVDVCQTPSELRVTVTNKLQAHNLPSGGVNRALVLQLWEAGRPKGVREFRLERRFRGPIGKRVKIKDSTLAPGKSTIWRVQRSYLQAPKPGEIHLRSQFFLGTDPNRNKPTSKVDIGYQKIPWASLPGCSGD